MAVKDKYHQHGTPNPLLNSKNNKVLLFQEHHLDDIGEGIDQHPVLIDQDQHHTKAIEGPNDAYYNATTSPRTLYYIRIYNSHNRGDKE